MDDFGGTPNNFDCAAAVDDFGAPCPLGEFVLGHPPLPTAVRGEGENGLAFGPNGSDLLSPDDVKIDFEFWEEGSDVCEVCEDIGAPIISPRGVVNELVEEARDVV